MNDKFHLKMATSLIASLLACSAVAATLTWDANNTGAGQTDGAGTWTDPDQWWNGAANVSWTDGNDVIIGNGGTGGTITVGTVSAGIVNLNNSFGIYTLQTGTLTQSGGFTVGAGANRVTLGSGMTLTGAGGLTVTGTTLTANAATLNYAGNTVVNGGGVLLAYNNLPSGNVNLNNGQLSDYYRTTTIFSDGLGTGADQIQIHGTSGFGGGNGNSNFRIGAQNSVLTWGSTHFDPTVLAMRTTADNNGPSIYGQVTLQNKLDLNSGSRTIDVYRSGANLYASSATIAAGIQDTGATGSLTKTGGGTLILGAASTWGGSTTVSGGLLDWGATNLANIGGGSGRNISVADGAVVKFGTLSNAILNRIAETTNEIGVMTGTTGNSFDFSGSTGANLPNAFLGNYAGNGAKAEMSGTITPGSDGYKFGALGSSGLLGIRDTLSGANKLTVGQTGSSGIRVNIVAANTHSGETVINTGSRLTLGNNLALQNSPLNVGSAGGNFSLAAGTNGGKITGETAAASPTFGGLIGSRNLISVFSSSVGNNETNLAAASVTGFTLNVASGNTFTYSGAIGGFGAGGASTLTKTGAGTQILSGANTYSGETTVTGGTLLVNGSTFAAGLVNVSSGATLGGSGSVGQVSVADGFLSPGDGLYNTFDMNSLTLDPSSTLVFGLDDPLFFLGSDLIQITNALTLAGQINIHAQSGGSGYDFLTATAGTQWLVMTYAPGNLFNAGAVTIGSAPALSNGLAWSVDTTTQDGSVFLTVVVPEPAAASLLAAGLLVLILRHRMS